METLWANSSLAASSSSLHLLEKLVEWKQVSGTFLIQHPRDTPLSSLAGEIS